MTTMMEFRTTGFNGYAVKFSAFHDNKLAVAASSNYGLVGNGRGYILGLTANGIIAETTFTTPDALYDIAWSENNERHVVAACGDGSVKLIDIHNPDQPVQTFAEHRREVYAVSWNQVSKDTFVSSSWDGTIKLWSPTRSQSLVTLPTHSCTYSAAFSPHSPSIITSVSSDSHLRVFDIRTPASASNHLVSLIPIHGPAPVPGGAPMTPHRYPPSEALCHDWNKYRDTVVATAGVDQMIRTFDIRNPRDGPMAVLNGHEYAVRKLAWSPHFSDVLLSGSYDMTARLWTDGTAMGVNPLGTAGLPRQIGQMDAHTEFVVGVDWCMYGAEGWVATAAWDQRVLVWDSRTVLGH